MPAALRGAHLRRELGKSIIGVVLDSSGSHHSGQVSWPRGMHPLYLPRYSPELNPAEQIFRQLRKTLSNRIFTTLDELQNALIDALQQRWRASDGAPSAHRLALVGRSRRNYLII